MTHGLAARLAGVRSGSGSGALGLNLNRTSGFGSGRLVNLDLDLGSGPVQYTLKGATDAKSIEGFRAHGNASMDKENEGGSKTTTGRAAQWPPNSNESRDAPNLLHDVLSEVRSRTQGKQKSSRDKKGVTSADCSEPAIQNDRENQRIVRVIKLGAWALGIQTGEAGEAIGGEEGGVRFEPESREHVCAAMDSMRRSVYCASKIKERRELVINGIAERGCIRTYGSVHIFGWDHDTELLAVCNRKRQNGNLSCRCVKAVYERRKKCKLAAADCGSSSSVDIAVRNTGLAPRTVGRVGNEGTGTIIISEGRDWCARGRALLSCACDEMTNLVSCPYSEETPEIFDEFPVRHAPSKPGVGLSGNGRRWGGLQAMDLATFEGEGILRKVWVHTGYPYTSLNSRGFEDNIEPEEMAPVVMVGTEGRGDWKKKDEKL
ncbi:hypothetical protein BGY98DRAFT_937847 [Russula aff. rugulosa BPL654]|nr:hypothetical protein BGY98DRAFT_937847 [Russula aff. rugulosa BPL654]